MDTPIDCIMPNEWSKLITRLANKGKITVRTTEHRFRGDARNITHINGKKLPEEISVEALTFAKFNNLAATARLLISLD